MAYIFSIDRKLQLSKLKYHVKMNPAGQKHLVSLLVGNNEKENSRILADAVRKIRPRLQYFLDKQDEYIMHDIPCEVYEFVNVVSGMVASIRCAYNITKLKNFKTDNEDIQSIKEGIELIDEFFNLINTAREKHDILYKTPERVKKLDTTNYNIILTEQMAEEVQNKINTYENLELTAHGHLTDRFIRWRDEQLDMIRKQKLERARKIEEETRLVLNKLEEEYKEKVDFEFDILEIKLRDNEVHSWIEEAKVTQKKWYCSVCDVQATDSANFNKHLETTKHKRKTTHITPTEYRCEKCNYIATSDALLSQHFKTKKHLRRTSEETSSTSNAV
ncbi:hypothetical protein EB118_24240 [bacterium]|nr:hypothetical protein [Actinomycetota bacterium]NDG33165.1 hypothetical protein [bacterium]